MTSASHELTNTCTYTNLVRVFFIPISHAELVNDILTVPMQIAYFSTDQRSFLRQQKVNR